MIPAPRLDAHQLRVCKARQGLIVVCAAAGSGKTETLAQRVVQLVREGVPAYRICVLAYNASAARGFRQRIAQYLHPTTVKRIYVATFHAFALRTLRDWRPNDRAYSQRRILGVPGTHVPSQFRMVMQALRPAKLALDKDTALMIVDRVNESMIDLDAFGPELPRRIASVLNIDHSMVPQYLTFLRTYRNAKKQAGCIDFSDMIADLCRELTAGSDRGASLGRRFHHVMVDEGQDLNPARLCIAFHLAHEARSLAVVGDTRQSIYGFSLSHPELFINLAQHEGADFMTLPVNRRSTQRIVETGNKIAYGHAWNVGGACEARPEAVQGEPVQVWLTPDPSAEVVRVLWDIQQRSREGGLVADGIRRFLVVARTNAWLINIEAGCVSQDIPCRVAGREGGVWSSTPGREILAYLRGAEGLPDHGLLTISNRPKRMLRGALVREAIEAARTEGTSVIEELVRLDNRNAGRFARDLSRLSRLRWDARLDATVALLTRALGRTGNAAALIAADERTDAYQALAAIARPLGSIAAIEAWTLAAAERASESGAVELSTIHRAKGAEAEVVYVVGCNGRRLPHERAFDHGEERRLLYVACTRAKETLVISTGGKPSPFLSDLEDCASYESVT